MRTRIFISLLFLMLLSACYRTPVVDGNVVPTTRVGKSKSEGLFKVGNSYSVDGRRYTPKETYSFTETGIASWYGPQFHGKPTANGEIFDMNELTAAHRTLQLPSLVRVTNLENGRSLIVRVNDRGPFKRGRIIDLSKRSAELLGFQSKGTAKVRIQVLGDESRAIAEIAKRGQSTRGIEVAMNENRSMALEQISVDNQQPVALARQEAVAVADISVPKVEAQPLGAAQIPGHVKNGNFLPDPVVNQLPVTPTSIYIQAGSFGNPENAQRLASILKEFGDAKVYPAVVDGKQFYRVRLGPVPDVDQADMVLARLANSGRGEAIIVVD